jgi:nitrous oxide reductase accessory protein NosL
MYLKKTVRFFVVLSCFLVLLGGLVHFNHSANAHFVKPVEEDKCPICGMSPSKHPDWVAVIMFIDGKHVKLHGPKNMFIFYFNIGKYDQKHERKNIATMHVMDYSTKKHIKAKEAYYVIGSGVMGPMGDELIPFENSMSSEIFKKDHGGKIITFNEITPEIINNLNNIIPDNSQ